MIRLPITVGSSLRPHRIARSGRKRAIDVTLAAGGLLVLAPLILFIAVAIVADSGWPPLFAQERIGLLGRPFRMWKVRTMTRDAEQLLAPLLALNEAPFPVFKVRDDPRVTRVGQLLRRTSLDELPQLWNVIRGEMSIVGPRPPLPDEVARYDALARQRLEVRPGLTCTWQIERRGRAAITFDEWVRMDLEYLARWSVATDLRLVWRTFGAIVRLTGE